MRNQLSFVIFPLRPPASQPFLPGSAPTPVSQISTFQQYGPPPASVQQLRNHMAGMTIGSTAASAPPPAGLGYGKVSWLQKYCYGFLFFASNFIKGFFLVSDSLPYGYGNSLGVDICHSVNSSFLN